MSQESLPRVTICLPTIGRLTYIQETLDSLKNQTLSAYELLILYNGTDADVLGKLQAFASGHPGGRVLAESSRMPMFANFNRGLREARGEYVAFFHDDDVYEPDFLKRTVGELDRNRDAAFAGTNYYIINSASIVTGHRRLLKRTGVQPGHDFIRELVKRGRGSIPTPGIVFRRSAFDERGWDENLSMHFGDFVVLMQMAEKRDAMLIAEPLMRIRLHERNASNVPLSIAAPMLYDTLRKYVTEFQERWPLLSDLAGELRASARNALTRFLVWGWISAEDDREAALCTGLLRQHGRGVLATVLNGMTRAGFAAARRRRLAVMVRRLGQVRG